MENLTRMEIWRMLMPKLELFSKHIMQGKPLVQIWP
ncbi:hypothetical protein AI22_20575 [Pseudomonas aeruginosa YL84]|nr:hypothetical protein AI22_20575 [Pseudomonas aeruginosa YL84]ETD86899.1 hypothetical protein V527_15260 [Pseudomonas aeruginosa VRFPA06]